jgi:hypothetical protein
MFRIAAPNHLNARITATAKAEAEITTARSSREDAIRLSGSSSATMSLGGETVSSFHLVSLKRDRAPRTCLPTRRVPEPRRRVAAATSAAPAETWYLTRPAPDAALDPAAPSLFRKRPAAVKARIVVLNPMTAECVTPNSTMLTKTMRLPMKAAHAAESATQTPRAAQASRTFAVLRPRAVPRRATPPSTVRPSLATTIRPIANRPAKDPTLDTTGLALLCTRSTVGIRAGGTIDRSGSRQIPSTSGTASATTMVARTSSRAMFIGNDS